MSRERSDVKDAATRGKTVEDFRRERFTVFDSQLHSQQEPDNERRVEDVLMRITRQLH
jgi:hypothetical protein